MIIIRSEAKKEIAVKEREATAFKLISKLFPKLPGVAEITRIENKVHGTINLIHELNTVRFIGRVNTEKNSKIGAQKRYKDKVEYGTTQLG
jgi:hypothetical protein